jgi:putative oxidoreductase
MNKVSQKPAVSEPRAELREPPMWRTEKPIAFIVLALALAAQIAWMSFNHFKRGAAWLSMSYPLEFALPFLLLLITGGRIRWVASFLRLPLALAFLSAVSDRLGLLGQPGAPGVAWGSFGNFIAYTAEVNSFMPAATIPLLAVGATICESTCGIALLLGWRIRWSALSSAVLLVLFATAMTVSGLSQFAYGVFAMSAGALALSTVDASLFSVDSMTRRRSQRPHC